MASERRRRSATSKSTSPRNTFRGRLRVGDRTMRMGFMGGALPLVGRSGICRERAEGAGEESQSSFHYRGAGGGLQAKVSGGNLGVDPRKQWSGIRDQGSVVRDQGSGIGDQRSEIRERASSRGARNAERGGYWIRPSDSKTSMQRFRAWSLVRMPKCFRAATAQRRISTGPH